MFLWFGATDALGFLFHACISECGGSGGQMPCFHEVLAGEGQRWASRLSARVERVVEMMTGDIVERKRESFGEVERQQTA